MGKIAVTGATGFVGRCLIRHLLARGELALAISRQPLDIAGVSCVSVPEYAFTPEVIENLRGSDALVHLAGSAHQPSSGAEAEAQIFKANVDIALNVARACVVAGVGRFVFVSSVGVNGSHSSKPFLDTDPPAPTEPYAFSKWKAEMELAQFFAGSKTELVVIRPPLVYGPGCPGNFERLVRFVASSPWVPLGALVAPRSFIHVVNLADALITAARYPGLGGATFLVSDGHDVSVGEVVSTLADEFTAGKARVINVPAPLLNVVAFLMGRRALFEKLASPLQIDASRFSIVTGWKPLITTEEGLRDTARGFRR